MGKQGKQSAERPFARVLFVGTWVALMISAASSTMSGQTPSRPGTAPTYQVDPFWPKPLPDRWLLVDVTGVCVDRSNDHVFILNHNNPTAQEEQIATVAPPVIEFDQQGNVVNSWGDRNLLPLAEPELHRGGPHGCFVDHEGNVWIGGTRDGIVQKYSHDGKLLLQIGTRGKWDSADKTIHGVATNSSHTLLNGPNAVAVDPQNGDVYIADGVASGNRRVVVFDHNGKFLRQWGRQATKEEAAAGVGGVFLDEGPHHLLIGNDGLVYVCDRVADRIEVFDKTGNFIRNIYVKRPFPKLFTVEMSGKVNAVGTVWQLALSPDRAQKYLYVADGGDEVVWIVDRLSGQVVSSFGRPGHLTGNFTGLHMLDADSKGNIITVETNGGRRVQRFTPVTPDAASGR